MSHSYHEGLPGYSAAQILHDGCPECEDRSKGSGLGIGQLDGRNFARAWRRAADWNALTHPVSDVSQAERPLLNALWSVQIQLERRGVPVGEVPYGLR